MKEKQFKKRSAILDCLMSTDLHPSAEMVYEMLHKDNPDISMATVYRNLSRFKDQGTITSIGTVNGKERFDGNTNPHVHFICSGCSAVLDMPGMENPQALCRDAANRSGYQVDGCALTFTGLCQSCQNELVSPVGSSHTI